MRLFVVAFVGFGAAALPAAASGGLSCEADDANVRFEATTGVSHSISSFFGFRAVLEVLVAGIPADFRKLDLAGDALIHSWLDGDEARLWLYHERPEGDFASVDLVVLARSAEEGEYHGTYRLAITAVGDGSVAKDWSAVGAVTCFSE